MRRPGSALGGAALCAAGLLLRRVSPRAGALLVGLGAAKLASDALGGGEPSAPVGYPPLDVPKPVADGVFVVDSRLPAPLGRAVAARMTVIRLPDGSLLLHSPTRHDAELQRALERIGPIRHLVAPNLAHWMFLRDWQRACPDAVTWAAPGLRDRRQVRRSGVRLDHELFGAAPAAWGGAVLLRIVRGGLGFAEAALFHQPTRTLVLTDLVLNLEPAKVPALLRPLMRLFGVLAPDGMPPPYLRAVVKLRRQEAARAAAELIELDPERVVFAHGRWFERDGAAALRRSLRWLVA